MLDKHISGVTKDMQSADFWVAKLDDPDRIIMESEALVGYNAALCAHQPDILSDFNAVPDILEREVLLRYLDEYPVPEAARFIGNIETDDIYWDAMMQRVNREGVREENAVHYGFAVCRLDVRSFPTDDALYESPEDFEFDQIQETVLDPGEPLVIFHQSLDRHWFFIQAGNYRGWVLGNGVARASSRVEWNAYRKAENFLVVSGTTLRLPWNPFCSDISGLLFQMGARLPLVPEKEVPVLVHNQMSDGCWVVRLPSRGTDGELKYRLALVPLNAEVSQGFVPYTRANIIRQAVRFLGHRYGWGGMFESVDCSSLVQNVFRSLGVQLPRNGGQQSAALGRTVDLVCTDRDEQRKRLESLLPGTTLHLPGHVMLLLGEFEGNTYAIHALAAMGDPDELVEGRALARIPVNSVVITDLSVLKSSGKRIDQLLTVGKQFDGPMG